MSGTFLCHEKSLRLSAYFHHAVFVPYHSLPIQLKFTKSRQVSRETAGFRLSGAVSCPVNYSYVILILLLDRLICNRGNLRHSRILLRNNDDLGSTVRSQLTAQSACQQALDVKTHTGADTFGDLSRLAFVLVS